MVSVRPDRESRPDDPVAGDHHDCNGREARHGRPTRTLAAGSERESDTRSNDPCHRRIRDTTQPVRNGRPCTSGQQARS